MNAPIDETTELQRFAQLLITLVRDQAIEACDRLARGEIRGPSGERWRSVMAEVPAQRALLELIPEIVVNELGSWEMAGWLAGGDWPRRYSAQRRHPYLADMKLAPESEGA